MNALKRIFHWSVAAVAGLALGSCMFAWAAPATFVNIVDGAGHLFGTAGNPLTINCNSGCAGGSTLPTNAAQADLQTAVQGSVPGGTAATNSELVGGQFLTSPTTLTNGQQAALALDSAHNLNVNMKTGSATISGDVSVRPSLTTNIKGVATVTDTTSTQLLAAVSSKVLYVTSVTCSNIGATNVGVTFQDASGGTAIWYGSAAGSMGGFNVSSGGGPPLFWTSSGNALFFAASGSTTSLKCAASGFSQ